MRPKKVLIVLDRMRSFWESKREEVEPGSKKFDGYSSQVSALEHAIRLVAFECQHYNALIENKEYTGNRDTGEFFREVILHAPKHEDQRTEA